MAENVAVTTLEIRGTEKVATSMKELKKQISDYRDELVALGQIEDKNEQQMEEQTRVIKKLQDATQLLSDVTNAHKKSSAEINDAIDKNTASYNQLQAELTRLKKAYKDMSAMERDSEFGQQTLNTISKLDVKLKDLDAGMGQYQRNVGNYGQTFEESMAQARQSSGYLAQGMGTLNGILALSGTENEGLKKAVTGVTLALQVMQNEGVSKLIIKLKDWLVSKTATTAATTKETAAVSAHATAMQADAAATTTATAATNGFKKALIATGIGAIIVAIGSLIAYWDELTKALGFAEDATDAETEALKKAEEAANEYRQAVGAAVSNSLSKYVKLRSEYKRLRSEHEKRSWIKENADAFNDLGISVNGLNDAEAAFVNNTQAVVDALIKRAVAAAKEQQLTKLAAKYMEEKMKAEAQYEKQAKRYGSKADAPGGGVFNENEDMFVDREGNWVYTDKGAAKHNENLKKSLMSTPNRIKKEMETLADELASDFAGQVIGGYKPSSSSSSSSSEKKDVKKETAEKLAALEEYEKAALELEEDYSEASWENTTWEITEKIRLEEEARQKERELAAERLEGAEEERNAVTESINAEIAAREEQLEKEKKLAKDRKKTNIEAAMQTAQATSSILGSIADTIEALTEDEKESAKKTKGIRIASTTIDTITGATGAYMQAAASIPPPAGIIVGAANAASVLATGMANIAKMKSTPVDTATSPSISTPSASVSAPNIPTQLDSVRNVTTASEEERLNKMAQSQKVYILQSDIEAAGVASKVQVTESTF